jgi:hypothetical protein
MPHVRVWVAVEACLGDSVCIQVAAMMVIGEVVLRCAVAGTDGGGGMWWPESIVEAPRMHVWVSHQAVVQTAVLCHQIQQVIFIYLKNYYSNGTC